MTLFIEWYDERNLCGAKKKKMISSPEIYVSEDSDVDSDESDDADISEYDENSFERTINNYSENFEYDKYFIMPLLSLKSCLASIRKDDDETYFKQNKKTTLFKDKNQLMYTLDFSDLELDKLRAFLKLFLNVLKKKMFVGPSAYICNNNGNKGFDILQALPGSKKQPWHLDHVDDSKSVIKKFGASIIINCGDDELSFSINKSEENSKGDKILLPPFNLLFYLKSVWHCCPANRTQSAVTKLFLYVDPYKGYRSIHKNKLYLYTESKTPKMKLKNVVKNKESGEMKNSKRKNLIFEDETENGSEEVKHEKKKRNDERDDLVLSLKKELEKVKKVNQKYKEKFAVLKDITKKI
jgi:hypothetical protein